MHLVTGDNENGHMLQDSIGGEGHQNLNLLHDKGECCLHLPLLPSRCRRCFLCVCLSLLWYLLPYRLSLLVNLILLTQPPVFVVVNSGDVTAARRVTTAVPGSPGPFLTDDFEAVPARW